MNPLQILGIGLGQSIGGALIGDIFQDKANSRQLEQNQKLLDMQSKANKDMYEFQLNQQKKFATDMSYSWQIEQMKKAGVNPALLYGSGGGSQPTLVGGATAPGTPNVQRQDMVMEMSARTAEINLMNAQAEKAKAEATKIGGVDTDLAKTNISSLTQGITESRAKTRLIEFQGDIEEINANFRYDTYEELIEQTKTATKNAIQGLRQLTLSNDFNEDTYKNRVNIVTGELLAMDLGNELLKKETENKEANTELTRQKIAESKEQIKQGWESLSLEAKQQGINWFNAQVNQQNATSNASNAYSNSIQAGAAMTNAATNAGKLEFDKWLNNVQASTKLTVETIGRIGQTIIQKIPFGGKK